MLQQGPHSPKHLKYLLLEKMFANPEADDSLSRKFSTAVKFRAPSQSSPGDEARYLGRWWGPFGGSVSWARLKDLQKESKSIGLAFRDGSQPEASRH